MFVADPGRHHQRDQLDHGQLADAKDTIAGWLQDIGVDPSTATNAKDEASRSVNDAASALLTGLGHGISALSGPRLLPRADRPQPVLPAHRTDPRSGPGPSATWASRPTSGTSSASARWAPCAATSWASRSSAGFNAVVVTLGALILGVPLVGTIAVVTLHRRVHPVSRGVDRRRLLGPARPRRSRARCGRRHDRRPAPRQRRPPADGPAVRDGGRARHPSPRRPDRHDRGRSAVRDGGPDPRGTPDVGDCANLR